MKRPRPLRALRRCCCGCSVGVIGLLAIAGWWVKHQLSPVSRQRTPIRVVIPPGASSSRVADILVENRLIRDKRLFLLYARFRGETDRLKAGSFRLSPDMTIDQIIARLGQGENAREDIAVTIPEGYTIRQIGGRMVEKGVLADQDELEKMALGPNERFSAPFPLPKKSLEGYLFPDTYRFLPKSTPEKVLQEMLDTFNRQFYSRHEEEIRRSPHTLHELVTIASLIEREAEVAQDRAAIAGVIENRLRIKMRLEIDATLDYAHGKHLSRVYYKDLEIKSPYNTYRRVGLPPGPIASPGLASLEAALNPERHDFLYYVALPGNGAHLFARTRAEHDANVAKRRAMLRTQ